MGQGGEGNRVSVGEDSDATSLVRGHVLVERRRLGLVEVVGVSEATVLLCYYVLRSIIHRQHSPSPPTSP